jgi:phage baseplate assembly protein W
MANINLNLDITAEQEDRGHTFRDIDFKFILQEGRRDFKTFTDIEAVRNGLRNIFSWRQGERIINPEFGNVLFRYIYEPMTETVLANIQVDVTNMITRWEPRVIINEIFLLPIPDQNELIINIQYRIPTLNNKVINFSTLINEEAVK